MAVAHSGNQNCSPEEAQAIATFVNTIMKSGSTWIDGNGQEKAITFEDIVIITPYNAQVFEIQQQASKQPSQSTQWQRQAMRMRRAVWNSFTASTA
jgi:ATP-dependent exoDNAse (exonuclease V) beta subunit